MTEQRKNFPDFYVTASQPCPYIPGRLERKLFTHLTLEKPPPFIDNLLRWGFRRSQNIAYMPYCEGCHACVSVRVIVDEFIPTASMRRIVASNKDILSRRVKASPNAEQFSLFRRYIDARHADGGMADMSALDYSLMVEESIIETKITEYRIKPAEEALSSDPNTWPLAAAALSDHLSDGISMVYSFYEPTENKRGLGTYMILETIQHAKSLGLPYVYLGYWIKGSRKMGYKTRFFPQEHLGQNGWERVASVAK
ncbi:MAG: arginyltransferase [Hyphomicrobium sp.]